MVEKKWRSEFEVPIDFEFPVLSQSYPNSHPCIHFQPDSEKYEVPGLLPKAPRTFDSDVDVIAQM